MFVTTQSFEVLPYSIPNLNLGEDESFDKFVEEIENTELPKAMGGYFYDLLVEGIESLPAEYDAEVATVVNQQYLYGYNIWKALTISTGVLPVVGADWQLIEEDNRWAKVLKGVKFRDSNRYYKWEGMESMVKPLIYMFWTRDNAQVLTDIGAVEPLAENATKSDPGDFIFKASLDYSEKMGGHCREKNSNSLYHYLYTVSSDFDDLFTADDYIDMKNYLNQEFVGAAVENDMDL